MDDLDSAEECLEACLEEESCTHFSYAKDNFHDRWMRKRCHLKYGTGDITEIDNMVSGAVFCPKGRVARDTGKVQVRFSGLTHSMAK